MAPFVLEMSWRCASRIDSCPQDLRTKHRKSRYANPGASGVVSSLSDEYLAMKSIEDKSLRQEVELLIMANYESTHSRGYPHIH